VGGRPSPEGQDLKKNDKELVTLESLTINFYRVIEVSQKFLRSFSEVSQKFFRSLSEVSQKSLRSLSEVSQKSLISFSEALTIYKNIVGFTPLRTQL
jgi:hypothetical protein